MLNFASLAPTSLASSFHDEHTLPKVLSSSPIACFTFFGLGAWTSSGSIAS
jgi:hypothetical protein